MASDLTWDQVALLRVMDEQGGFTAGDLGQGVWTASSKRQAASCATPCLKELERLGLVGRLDDERPIAWCRTPAGTAALAEAERESGRGE